MEILEQGRREREEREEVDLRFEVDTEARKRLACPGRFCRRSRDLPSNQRPQQPAHRRTRTVLGRKKKKEAVVRMTSNKP
jgi:hypothetical protein